MSEELQVFNFNDEDVRVVDKDGNPWFVAKDVCMVLGIKNHKDAVRRLDDDEKSGVGITDPHGRVQRTHIISESGLYLIMRRSHKPIAKKFDKWLRSVVIPSIREKGYYSTKPLTSAEMLLAAAQELVEHEKRLKDHEERISMIEEQQQDAMDALMDVEFADEEPTEKTLRAKINQLIRAYCLATGADYRDIWNQSYTDYKYRYQVDLKRRAKNRGMRPLDIAEQIGGLGDLFKVVSKICREQELVPTPTSTDTN